MRCFIPTCRVDLNKRKYRTGCSSHRLPKMAKDRLAWLKALDPSGNQYMINNQVRICSRHFQESDFYEKGGRRNLYKGAVPSVGLGPAAKLPPADIPDESHYVFLDESEMALPDLHIVPVAFQSTAIEALQVPVSIESAKPVRYAEDMNDDDVSDMSPEEAQEMLPKVYKQLQQAKLRLSCYKHQNLRLQKKVEQMKEIIMELSNQHDGVIPIGNDQQLVTEVKVEPTTLSEWYYE